MAAFGYDNGWTNTSTSDTYFGSNTVSVVYNVTSPTSLTSMSFAVESAYSGYTSQYVPYDDELNREAREFIAALDRAKKRRIVLPPEPWSPSVSEERRPAIPKVLLPRIMRVQARGG